MSKLEYWSHWHNVRYEINRRIEGLCLKIAYNASGRLRSWFVIESVCKAKELYPELDYDDLTFKEILDGALRKKSDDS